MFLDGVFGTEMPFVVKFFLAFLLVLGLIGVGAWALRRFGTGVRRTRPFRSAMADCGPSRANRVGLSSGCGCVTN